MTIFTENLRKKNAHIFMKIDWELYRTNTYTKMYRKNTAYFSEKLIYNFTEKTPFFAIEKAPIFYKKNLWNFSRRKTGDFFMKI